MHRLLLSIACLAACGDAAGPTSEPATTTGVTMGVTTGETGAPLTGTGDAPTGTGGEASTSGASTGEPASETGADTTTAGTTGAADCDPPVPFSTVNSTIFSGCGGYIGCHLKPPFGGSLDLTPASAYDALVGVPSAIAPAELRVAPGDSANSLLYRKLIDDLAPDMSEGGPMPKNMLASMWTRLSDEDIELVRCWIDQGAQND